MSLWRFEQCEAAEPLAVRRAPPAEPRMEFNRTTQLERGLSPCLISSEMRLCLAHKILLAAGRRGLR